MRVALICHDRPDALSLRQENREAHLAYLNASDAVELAGPFLDGAGRMTGSLIVLSVASMAEALAWAEADPYARAGLFATVTMTEWKRVIG